MTLKTCFVMSKELICETLVISLTFVRFAVGFIDLCYHEFTACIFYNVCLNRLLMLFSCIAML